MDKGTDGSMAPGAVVEKGCSSVVLELMRIPSSLHTCLPAPTHLLHYSPSPLFFFFFLAHLTGLGSLLSTGLFWHLTLFWVFVFVFSVLLPHFSSLPYLMILKKMKHSSSFWKLSQVNPPGPAFLSSELPQCLCILITTERISWWGLSLALCVFHSLSLVIESTCYVLGTAQGGGEAGLGARE